MVLVTLKLFVRTLELLALTLVFSVLSILVVAALPYLLIPLPRLAPQGLLKILLRRAILPLLERLWLTVMVLRTLVQSTVL